MVAETLLIPPLVSFSIHCPPGAKSLGLLIRQVVEDDYTPRGAVEVVRIAPGGPASTTPLRPGFEILSINDHRVRDAQRCMEMLKFYTSKGGTKKMEMVASGGARPPGALYVMVKRNKGGNDNDTKLKKDGPLPPLADDPGDGTFQGLILEEKSGGRVRVAGFGEQGGIFLNTRINKGDIILSIDGRTIHSIDDCKRALRKATRLLIPVLTYNSFRKFRSGIVIDSTTSRGHGSVEAAAVRTNDEKEERKEPEKFRSRCVGDLYAFGSTIGEGGFSVVKKCKLKETGECYAMKIVSRRKLDKALELALRDEISILNSLNHPHILRLYDTFVTINSYYLVTEYLEGGELFDRIVEKTVYTEKEARDVCAIIFGAMQHCHKHRIAHRDLKPENLLLRDKHCDLELKIADFGFAKHSPMEDSLQTFCGSPGYVSPEILNKVPYGTKTDMWSIGVIIFTLLGGYHPFQNPKRSKQYENMKKAKYEYSSKYWGNVTEEAKSLIDSLLCVDPNNRLSAADAMEHPWMIMDHKQLRKSSLLKSIENMRELQVEAKFKAAVQSVVFVNKMNLTAGELVDEGEQEDEEPRERKRRGSVMNTGFNLRRKDTSLSDK